MKKLFATLILSILLVGCAEQPQPKQYITEGRYYTDGTVITSDGNEWGYSTDIISDEPAYDNQPVFVAFDDNGTPDNIYDDTVLGLTWNVETAIYDRLETALGDKFHLERDGNNIKIKDIK